MICLIISKIFVNSEKSKSSAKLSWLRINVAKSFFVKAMECSPFNKGIDL